MDEGGDPAECWSCYERRIRIREQIWYSKNWLSRFLHTKVRLHNWRTDVFYGNNYEHWCIICGLVDNNA